QGPDRHPLGHVGGGARRSRQLRQAAGRPNPARCGHGPRLPLLVISPWAIPNYIDHTLTNQASVINFIESNWRLGTIDPPGTPNGQGSFDRTAGTLMNLFNFEARPSLDTVLLNCNGTYVAHRRAAPSSCP